MNSWSDGAWNNSVDSWVDNGWNNSVDSWVDHGWNNSVDSWSQASWDDDSWSDSWYDDTWSDWSNTKAVGSSWSNSTWSNFSIVEDVNWEDIHNVGNIIGIILNLLLIVTNLFYITTYCFTQTNITNFTKLIIAATRILLSIVVLWVKPLRKLIITSVAQAGLSVWTIFDIISLF